MSKPGFTLALSHLVLKTPEKVGREPAPRLSLPPTLTDKTLRKHLLTKQSV